MRSFRNQPGVCAISPAVLVAVAVAMSFCAAAEASAFTTAGSMPEQAALATQNGRQAVTRLVGRLHDAARSLLRNASAPERRDVSMSNPGTALPMPVSDRFGWEASVFARLHVLHTCPALRDRISAWHLALPPPVA